MTRIVDAHHHFWRQQDQPWLRDPVVPRIFGPYESIRRDYPIAEFLDDQAGSGVERSVYVQTNWAPDDYEKEAAWVQATSLRTGWPHAAVFYANMLVDDVRGQLDRLVEYPLIRGVRMQLHWHENPEFRFASRADEMNDERIQRNVEHLSEYGLSFDLQVFPGQMSDSARMVAANPDVDFILVHAGMLSDRSETEVLLWRTGLGELAKLPNAYVKLSGLGTFIHRNDPAHIAFVVQNCVELFGADRCMFGSNFPIEKIWTDHRSLMNAYLDAIAPYPTAERDAILGETASHVYGLDAD